MEEVEGRDGKKWGGKERQREEKRNGVEGDADAKEGNKKSEREIERNGSGLSLRLPTELLQRSPAHTLGPGDVV
ncbi:hypothetical protein PAMA_013101 [Pampus argenteus]